ncbi:acid phosphatase det1, partial [Physocladia obscura]
MWYDKNLSVLGIVRARETGRLAGYRMMRRAVKTLVPSEYRRVAGAREEFQQKDQTDANRRFATADATLRSVNISAAIVSHVLGFSADGSLLLCLGQANHSLVAFRYSPDPSLLLDSASYPPFQLFFRQTPVFETTITAGAESLIRDFCLFTANRKFVLLASALPMPATERAANASRYPHSIESLRFLDNITFWLICLSTGAVLDRLHFPANMILLSHAAGVQIYGEILAITSIKDQTIHLFHVQDTGRFVKLREIGWHNNDDDEYVLAEVRAREDAQWREAAMKSSNNIGNHNNIEADGIGSSSSVVKAKVNKAISTFSDFSDEWLNPLFDDGDFEMREA